MSAKQKRRVGGVEYEGSTPLDETLKIALDADKEITQLKALNAELLEALEAAERDLQSAPHSWGFEFTSLPKIRAALAKARN